MAEDDQQLSGESIVGKSIASIRRSLATVFTLPDNAEAFIGYTPASVRACIKLSYPTRYFATVVSFNSMPRPGSSGTEM